MTEGEAVSERNWELEILQAEHAASAARGRKYELERAQGEAGRRAEAAARAEFDGRVNQARGDVVECERLLGELKVAARDAGHGLPAPIGTVFEYARDGWQRGMRGKRARLEVFKIGDPWPSGRSYGRPNPGDLVLRPLLKSGEAGSHCIRLLRDEVPAEWKAVTA